jgi:putative cardiolipin synthase
MHNKSFTADNQATIVGGRNVGDEYFGATNGVLFADLDLLAVGPVVQEVSRAFDRYWASASSYPVEGLLPAVRPDRIAEVSEAARKVERSPEARRYVAALRETSLVRRLVAGTLELDWVSTRIVCDDPAKGLNQAPPESLVYRQLKEILGDPRTGLALVSPYFVPTAEGVAWFSGLAKRGVRVQVLTNSLEATDVSFVHAGYAKRRRPLLKSGITLFELRRHASGSGSPKTAGGAGSSGASLHAKTFAVDGTRVFVGSFNFDPRSAKLNTEMGLVVESPALARQDRGGLRHGGACRRLRSAVVRHRRLVLARAACRRIGATRDGARHAPLATCLGVVSVDFADRVAALTANARPAGIRYVSASKPPVRCRQASRRAPLVADTAPFSLTASARSMIPKRSA